MATNVTEKDRALNALDDYINALDDAKYLQVYEQLRRSREHVSASTDSGEHHPDYGNPVIKQSRLTVVDDDGSETCYGSLTVYGPSSSFTVGVPSVSELELLYSYAGYRYALAKVHAWITEHKGYSGGMPSEVPNQSETGGVA